MRVLLIRPRAQSEATACRLRAQGHESVIDPILEIRPLPLPPLDSGHLAAVLVTSANAAAALPPALHRLPLFTVGAATAAAVRDQGCPDVRQGPGDGVGLAGLVMATLPAAAGTVLHLAGAEVSPGLARTLEAAGYDYRKVTAYAASPTDAPAASTVRELRHGTLDAVLLHSPRSARTWMENVRARDLEPCLRRLLACCISPATAQPLREATFAEVRVAARPEETALVGCLATQQPG